MRPWPLFVLALGCGPSFQAIYEGDARFEHCYAMDDNPSTPLQAKSDCWSDWTKHYTYGQTRDRVEYATMRYRALARVPNAPTDEAMMGAAPGEGATTSSLSAPAPTSAFAPPPKTEEVADAGGASPAASTSSAGVPADAGAHATPVPVPPETACLGTCGDAWQTCKVACASAAGGCPACDKTYGRCAKACFR
jgi:hypothetical protein